MTARDRIMLEQQIDELKQRIEALENRYFRPLPPTSADGSDAGSNSKNGGSKAGKHLKTAEVTNDTA